MIRSTLGTAALLLMLPSLALAQNSSRTVERIEQKGHRLEVVTNDGVYRITPYSDRIMETVFVPRGEAYDARSHAVVMAPKAAGTLRTSGGAVEFATAGISATVTRSPFGISYSYKGRPLLAEKNGYTRKDKLESIDFALAPDEALYGGGARALGMNRRGHRLPLYNKAHYGYGQKSAQMSFGMPLVLSSKMYMVHFDNPTTGFLDLDAKKANVLSYEPSSGRKAYQVIAGDSWEQLAYEYTSLTGRQPLPPRWAFGNFASRFGYHSEAEARATVDKFIAGQVPLDAIVFDLYWFGPDMRGSMGNFSFDKNNFPNPRQMMADFSAKGVKTVLITEPFVLTASKRWPEAVARKVLATDDKGAPFTYDFYFGNTGLIDITSPAARNWLWDIYKELAPLGVAGWWGDLGEPEVHPDATRHVGGSAAQVHNIYGHEWARLIHEGYRKDFPLQRPFILMRSGYSGSQRFGMIPWSGDVSRSWDGLKPQPEISLQMGMQGAAYMHSDLGGFAGATLDDELYTRWLQYGVFQPIFRPHAQEDVASEPVFRSPAALALAREAIRLRYRLLPYNYTAAFDNNQAGLPLMRPLMYEEPGNPKLRDLSSAYLWGNDILVSPVLEAKKATQEVYFPATGAWLDFHTGQRHEGGTSAQVALAADRIPAFVRAGAFIPMARAIQTTRDYSSKNIELHYYHDRSVAAGSGKMYDDDGETPEAFEKGKYELLQFASRMTGNELAITVASEAGANWKRHARSLSMVVHNLDGKPAQVEVDGRAVPFDYQAGSSTLVFEAAASADARRRFAIRM
ncbi:MAG TPA: TIM-barrel domain-containing protein [Telluria sp.]